MRLLLPIHTSDARASSFLATACSTCRIRAAAAAAAATVQQAREGRLQLRPCQPSAVVQQPLRQHLQAAALHGRHVLQEPGLSAQHAASQRQGLRPARVAAVLQQHWRRAAAGPRDGRCRQRALQHTASILCISAALKRHETLRVCELPARLLQVDARQQPRTAAKVEVVHPFQRLPPATRPLLRLRLLLCRRHVWWGLLLVVAC
jgi:hypothetical protein